MAFRYNGVCGGLALGYCAARRFSSAAPSGWLVAGASFVLPKR
jgi:hypothetical protein